MNLVIDPGRMTLRDMEDFETATGEPIGKFLGKFQGRDAADIQLSDFPAKMLTAMVWVFGRKSQPGLTLEDARELGLKDLEFDSPPVSAGGVQSASSGSRNSRGSTASRRRISGG